MTVSWNRKFHNIALVCEPQIIRVKNDAVLMNALAKHGRKRSRQIAAYAHAYYNGKYGRQLRISERSLACEIFGHYFIMKTAMLMRSRHIALRFATWLIRHMDVIDCGERGTDSNRFVWDILSVFF